jgi:hypothetical protein
MGGVEVRARLRGRGSGGRGPGVGAGRASERPTVSGWGRPLAICSPLGEAWRGPGETPREKVRVPGAEAAAPDLERRAPATYLGASRRAGVRLAAGGRRLLHSSREG